MKIQRCVIYCRTSSEEGLGQDFNSLDAQSEACEAFIKSQTSLNWKKKGKAICDGGFSGGSMDRPGLQSLLEMVRLGQVDCIVVYKVDRLTRSLSDFAQLVELLDEHKVSFVSVTQQFNTTNSMGRLTLNVLLSFAQFEREVTAERIRDKISASKQKGMWMGGTCPLGYKPCDRTLEIVEPDAVVVRDIFDRYERLSSVAKLVEELRSQGIKAPRRLHSTGRPIGGKWFTKGHLYHLLKNPVYVGRIPHKEQSYEGQHEAIVAQSQFDRVQQQLGQNTSRKQVTNLRTEKADLRGRVVDEAGRTMGLQATTKGGRHYRYYVSPSSSEASQRVSADELERAIGDRLQKLAQEPATLLKVNDLELTETELVRLSKVLSKLSAIQKIQISPDGEGLIEFHAVQSIPEIKDLPALKFSFRPAANSRKGRVATMRAINNDAQSETAYQVHLRTAFKAWDAWQAEPELSMTQLADKLSMDRSRLGKVIRLRFLSPKIVSEIQAGKMLTVGAEQLVRKAIPAKWCEQEQWLFAP